MIWIALMRHMDHNSQSDLPSSNHIHLHNTFHVDRLVFAVHQISFPQHSS